MRVKKFKLNLIQEIVLRKKQNYFRLYVALYLYDENGQGWIRKKGFIDYVVKLTGYKKKTVVNKILSMIEMGWITENGGRIFYKSQEKILAIFEYDNPSYSAAYISESDLDCTLIEWRAFLYEATIDGTGKGRMVSRAVIKDKMTGHSKATQKKYENIRGIAPRANYAIVGSVLDDVMELTYKYCQPIFKRTINGVVCFVRRLPNTYETQIRTGKRIRDNVIGAFYEPVPTVLNRIYFGTSQSTNNKNISTGYIFKREGLWVAI